MRSHLTSITLMGSTLLLREPDGKYVHAGFVQDDFVHEVTETSKRNRLGLKVGSDEKIDLDGETLRLFVEYDTGLTEGKRFNRIVELYSKMYRLIVMGISDTTNTAFTLSGLKREIAQYEKWAGYCQA